MKALSPNTHGMAQRISSSISSALLIHTSRRSKKASGSSLLCPFNHMPHPFSSSSQSFYLQMVPFVWYVALASWLFTFLFSLNFFVSPWLKIRSSVCPLFSFSIFFISLSRSLRQNSIFYSTLDFARYH